MVLFDRVRTELVGGCMLNPFEFKYACVTVSAELMRIYFTSTRIPLPCEHVLFDALQPGSSSITLWTRLWSSSSGPELNSLGCFRSTRIQLRCEHVLYDTLQPNSSRIHGDVAWIHLNSITLWACLLWSSSNGFELTSWGCVSDPLESNYAVSVSFAMFFKRFRAMLCYAMLCYVQIEL